jgi:hypothetical protein
VLDQLDAEDEKRPEAAAELRAATECVDAHPLKAFQHHGYVTRTDKVEVDWQRFDDDTKSSLKASHVWHALSHIGRAVYPGKLSGTYLRRLLAKMSRTLNLKAIGQQFFKNPAFPMVPSVEDIRRAVFETLSGQECYQPAAGAQPPPHPAEGGRGVGHVVERAGRDDGVEAALVGVPRAHVALAVGQPARRRRRPRRATVSYCIRAGHPSHEVPASWLWSCADGGSGIPVLHNWR